MRSHVGKYIFFTRSKSAWVSLSLHALTLTTDFHVLGPAFMIEISTYPLQWGCLGFFSLPEEFVDFHRWKSWPIYAGKRLEKETEILQDAQGSIVHLQRNFKGGGELTEVRQNLQQYFFWCEVPSFWACHYREEGLLYNDCFS